MVDFRMCDVRESRHVAEERQLRPRAQERHRGRRHLAADRREPRFERVGGVERGAQRLAVDLAHAADVVQGPTREVQQVFARRVLAVPGGFIEQRETAYQSAVRELREETGFELLPSEMEHACKGMRVFDHPDRSQRGRVITHAFYFDLGQRLRPEIAGSDDAAEARWVKIADLAGMEEEFHDDHFHILDAFLGIT